MRNTVVLAVLLAMACGNDKVPLGGGGNIDAPEGPDGPPIDGPGLALDCQSYCGAIQSACTGVRAQYDSVADCLGTCEHLPVGQIEDTTGNTLGCRVYHTDF